MPSPVLRPRRKPENVMTPGTPAAALSSMRSRRILMHSSCSSTCANPLLKPCEPASAHVIPSDFSSGQCFGSMSSTERRPSAAACCTSSVSGIGLKHHGTTDCLMRPFFTRNGAESSAACASKASAAEAAMPFKAVRRSIGERLGFFMGVPILTPPAHGAASLRSMPSGCSLRLPDFRGPPTGEVVPEFAKSRGKFSIPREEAQRIPSGFSRAKISTSRK